MNMTLPRILVVLTSVLAQLSAETPLPRFSWDKVPVYEMFGDGSRLLKDEELKHIAGTTDFLCIEKNHAISVLKSADHGAAREIARFKKLDPGTTCLFYFNSAYAYPFASRSQMFRIGRIPAEYKDFLITDPDTGKFSQRGNVPFFDVLNPDFRKWWAAEVGRYVEDTGADGLFVDQMHGFVFLRPQKRREVEEAQAEMMSMAKKAIGSDKILLLNNGAHIPELFEIGDSFMFEHYKPETLTKEAILKDWKLMEQIAGAGKSSVWRIGLEIEGKLEAAKLTDADYQERARKELSYHLAVFLAGACEYSYFQYGWGWLLRTGPLMSYPEFERPLGKPIGPRTRPDAKGWVFLREFEQASVRVDLEKREGAVTWRKGRQ
ncbi:putative glycoside hydrolase [Haloferula sp.]|uniref:putative glycoside hydrolase n=1 Tax=Haloferula sp. TaxID=2497595 RepID=UPI003C778D9F